jgi:hypothetical protein
MTDWLAQKYFSANETGAKIFFERTGSAREKSNAIVSGPGNFLVERSDLLLDRILVEPGPVASVREGPGSLLVKGPGTGSVQRPSCFYGTES